MRSAVRNLTVRELEVRRGTTRLVEDLSFTVEAGQRALIVGRNGTGKTSLLRILAGIAPAGSGEVRLDDMPSTQWGPEERARLAYRGHLDGLKLDLTGRENIMFYASLRDRPGACDPEILAALGIERIIDRPMRYLSAGQRRRVGLATLLSLKADVWFLDEPITNLDSEGRAIVAGWLDEHTAAGGIAVVATHNPEQMTAPGTVLVEL